MKKLILCISSLLVVSHANAGGYRVAVQGQKALGMGHAGVAMAESAETVFFNPAGMTELTENLQVVSGIGLIESSNRYQNEDTNSSASTDNPIGTPINFYMSRRFSDAASIGFGLYTPYGSSVEWEKDWVGSHLINNIELQAVFLQPTVAYKVNDRFSIGGGPIVAIGSVELNRNLTTSLQNADGRSNVTLEDSGIIEFGYNLGGFFAINDRLDIGINYRSEIIMHSEGDADFENIPAALSAVFVDGSYTAELPLPAELTLGLAYQLTDKITIAADYNYTFWDVYDELMIEFDSLNDPNSNPSVSPRNYKNASTYRVGFQYQQSNELQLRGGLYYDETPIRDGYFAPETPRGDSLGFTAGLTYQLSKQLAVDLAGFYLHFNEVNNSYDYSSEGVFEGAYKVSVWALGLGLTYQF
jgi:long-chain fatty acid transport protein